MFLANLHAQIILSCSTVISGLRLFLFLSLGEGLLLGSSLRCAGLGRTVRMRKAAVMMTHISFQPL